MIELVSVLGDLMPFRHGNLNQTFKASVRSKNKVEPFTTVVKDLPVRELFNEIVSYVVLRSLGLPIPTVYLGMVSGLDKRIAKAPTLGNGDKLVYVSEAIPSPNLKMSMGWADGQSEETCRICLEKFVPKLAVWKRLGELYAFDTWVANTDRNLGNLLYGGNASNGEPEIWLIDHGRSFTGESWGPSDLVPERLYQNLLKVWASPFLTEKQKKGCLDAAEIFAENAKKLDVSKVIESYCAALGLTSDDQDAAKNFLGVRLGKMSEHAKDALVMEEML